MQAPPPVSNLLIQLETLTTNLQGLLSQARVDWYWRPEPDEWSITEVVCHLRDVEKEVHQVRLKSLIESDNAFLQGVAADEWASERGYQQQDGKLALDQFVVERQDTIGMLKPLDQDVWRREGRHAFFGQTSLHELVYLAVRHDEIHWDQIKNIVNVVLAQS